MLLGQLAERFELGSLSRGASQFDRGRIDWLSQEHLKRLNVLELARRVGQVLEQRGVVVHPTQLTALGPALRGAHTLLEAADDAEAVLVPPRRRPELDAGGRAGGRALRRCCAASGRSRSCPPTTPTSCCRSCHAVAPTRASPARDVKRGLRRALTGRERGVALPHVVAAIERDDAIRRAAAAGDAAA